MTDEEMAEMKRAFEEDPTRIALRALRKVVNHDSLAYVTLWSYASEILRLYRKQAGVAGEPPSKAWEMVVKDADA